MFDTSSGPLPKHFSFSRVEDMMLGLGIGYALGRPTEGMVPEIRIARFREIHDYLPSPYAGGPIGVPSDDTQLAFRTLEQMIEDQDFIPENIAERFCRIAFLG